MDRLDAMSVFLAAARAGSLSKASRQLGLPLASVSRKVAELEEHLKATLLKRSAKGLELTPAGRSYVVAAESILEQVVEAERTAAGEYAEPRGDLVVTAAVMFGRLHVLPVVTDFLSAYPTIGVNLMLTDRIAHFVDDHLDIAIRCGELPDSSLVARRLGTIRKVVCASPDYLAANGTPLVLDDLARHNVISFEGVSSPNTWFFRSGDIEKPVSFRSRLGVDSIDAAIAAGLAGAGLVRAMSYQVVDYVRTGRMVIVLDTFERPPLPVHLVYDRKDRLPLKLRAFVDFVVPRLRERLAGDAL